ncbi:MAG: NTP transferase domain-containing protein [Bacteroidota bacterium]
MSATIDAILLAAGNSSRMGRPKQALPVEGLPLLVRTIRVLKNSGSLRNIVVVTGAGAESLTPLIAEEALSVIENNQWSSGMGSSLKSGLDFLLRQTPVADGVLVSVCDQPFLSVDVIRAIANHAAMHPLIASNYGEVLGPPSFFGREFFMELMELPDEGGARTLFNRYPHRVTKVPFPDGAIDLDTPEDYERYLNRT